MLYTRRDIGKIALASVPLAAAYGKPDSKFNGVQIGAITYSFRTMTDLDEVIKAYVDIGLSEMEIMSSHAEDAAGAPAASPAGGRRGPATAPAGAPTPGAAAAGRKGGGGGGRGPAARVPRTPMTEEQIAAAREQPRAKEMLAWRKSVSMDKYKAIGKKVKDAGIDLKLLCYNMNQAITDDEIEYVFNMAKALGADAISTSTQVTVSKRVAPFATKHKMMVGYHGHDATWDPNEFSTPETFAAAMEYSKYNGVNLDIGHFVGANQDPVAYIKQHHARITNLHLKDKKKDHGANFPWGQGDTPIKDVLLLMKKEKYKFPGNIEMEYQVPEGSTLIGEMKKCVQYCKEVLA